MKFRTCYIYGIYFRTSERPGIKSPESGPKILAYPRSVVPSKSANPLNVSQASAIRALFKAKSVDPRTYSPPPFAIARSKRCRKPLQTLRKSWKRSRVSLKTDRPLCLPVSLLITHKIEASGCCVTKSGSHPRVIFLFFQSSVQL